MADSIELFWPCQGDPSPEVLEFESKTRCLHSAESGSKQRYRYRCRILFSTSSSVVPLRLATTLLLPQLLHSKAEKMGKIYLIYVYAYHIFATNVIFILPLQTSVVEAQISICASCCRLWASAQAMIPRWNLSWSVVYYLQLDIAWLRGLICSYHPVKWRWSFRWWLQTQLLLYSHCLLTQFKVKNDPQSTNYLVNIPNLEWSTTFFGDLGT